MLSYFPTPYPDELWYSVLCRYHIRSGNRTSAATFRELFGGEDHKALSPMLSTHTVSMIADQLPEGLLDKKDMVLNHTMFKYLYRFEPPGQRKAAWRKIHKNEPLVRKQKWRTKDTGLKSCPLCMKEDKAIYGETYWHLKHQIPRIPLCHKHHCRLICHQELSDNKLYSNFILPEMEQSADEEITAVSELEIALTEILVQYQELPFKMGAAEGHNPLYENLLNDGYGLVRDGKNQSLDYRRLDQDLCAHFGKEVVERYFGRITSATFRMIRDWKCKVPERYALLSLFIHQTPEELFRSEPVENKVEKEFLELSKSGIIRSKKYVAKRLGVPESRLGDMASRLHVEPFWEQKPDADDPKCVKRYIGFKESEWNYVSACVEKYGFQSPSAFVRHCVNYINDHEEECLPRS